MMLPHPPTRAHPMLRGSKGARKPEKRGAARSPSRCKGSGERASPRPAGWPSIAAGRPCLRPSTTFYCTLYALACPAGKSVLSHSGTIRGRAWLMTCGQKETLIARRANSRCRRPRSRSKQRPAETRLVLVRTAGWYNTVVRAPTSCDSRQRANCQTLGCWRR
jgi:hypothetical protein